MTKDTERRSITPEDFNMPDSPSRDPQDSDGSSADLDDARSIISNTFGGGDAPPANEEEDEPSDSSVHSFDEDSVDDGLNFHDEDSQSAEHGSETSSVEAKDFQTDPDSNSASSESD